MIVTQEWFFTEQRGASGPLFQRGLVARNRAGSVIFSPLGLFLLDSLKARVKEFMDREMVELRMPVLQSVSLWKRSGRWESFEDKFVLSKDRVLSATNEEDVVETLLSRSQGSWGTSFYQTNWKFRDEKRQKGLMRCQEFLMKDGYSVHTDATGAYRKLATVHALYLSLYLELGLDVLTLVSQDKQMGGNLSFEHVVVDEQGESELEMSPGRDTLTGIPFDCREVGAGTKCVELSHIFYLGDAYTHYAPNERDRGLVACSYGIGVTRLLEVLYKRRLWRFSMFGLVLVVNKDRDICLDARSMLRASRPAYSFPVWAVSDNFNKNYSLEERVLGFPDLLFYCQDKWVLKTNGGEYHFASLESVVDSNEVKDILSS